MRPTPESRATIDVISTPSAIVSTLPERVDRAWLDRLVDLQILARHGDLEAIVVAHRWLTHDADARRMWATIAERCSQVSSTGSDT